MLQLHKRAAFKAGYFIELQDVAKNFGIADMSLQKLYANLFHQKISKAQRLSNWEASDLSCINLYEEFKRLSATGDYELDELRV
ncbi:Uncharacterised protein [Segatella copri]|nr:Uncharacterised protein [Segatella copri]